MPHPAPALTLREHSPALRFEERKTGQGAPSPQHHLGLGWGLWPTQPWALSSPPTGRLQWAGPAHSTELTVLESLTFLGLTVRGREEQNVTMWGPFYPGGSIFLGKTGFEKSLLLWHFPGPSVTMKAEETLAGIRNFLNWVFWTHKQGLL